MRYVFSPGDSTVSIVAHSPLHDSHAKSTKVTGEFTATFDGGVPEPGAQGYAEVRVDTFSSGNKLLEMNTLRHIGARKFPVARFDIGTVDTSDGRVKVTGTLDFHGVQRQIEADVVVDMSGDTVTLTGDWILTQTQFGLKPPRLAMLKVDDDIAVAFRLVARAASQ